MRRGRREPSASELIDSVETKLQDYDDHRGGYLTASFDRENQVLTIAFESASEYDTLEEDEWPNFEKKFKLLTE